MRGKTLREVCKISEATQKSIDEAKAKFSFSQSRTDSLLRVARTIADMVGSDAVEKWHFKKPSTTAPSTVRSSPEAKERTDMNVSLDSEKIRVVSAAGAN